MVGSIVEFLTSHSETLIGVSAALILLLSGVLIYLNVFVGSSGAEADLDRLEASIEKLLSRAEGFKGVAGSGAASGEAAEGGKNAGVGEGDESATVVGGTTTENLPEDVVALQEELKAKREEVAELRQRIESGEGADTPDGADDNTPELLAKIQELEDRLAEYEIIEDDIADLSHYKEENVRLKKELAEVKGGTAVASDSASDVDSGLEAAPDTAEDEAAADLEALADGLSEGDLEATEDESATISEAEGELEEVASASISESEVEENAAADDVASEDAVDPELAEAMAELEAASVEEAEEAEADVSASGEDEAQLASPLAEEMSEPDPEDIEKDFAKTLEDLETPEAAVSEPAQEAEVASAAETSKDPESGVTEPVDEMGPAESEKISAENSSDDIFAEMNAEDSEADPMAGLGDIDTNRMLEELKGLEAEMGSAGADVLAEDTDVDKMASEAKDLENKS